MIEWDYYILFDTPRYTEDEPLTVARVRKGWSEFDAEVLLTEGSWRRSDMLYRARFQGDPEWRPVSRDRARELATWWYATGRRGDIPDDLRDTPRP